MKMEKNILKYLLLFLFLLSLTLLYASLYFEGSFFSSFALNFSTELIGILFTLLLVNKTFQIYEENKYRPTRERIYKKIFDITEKSFIRIFPEKLALTFFTSEIIIFGSVNCVTRFNTFEIFTHSKSLLHLLEIEYSRKKTFDLSFEDLLKDLDDIFDSSLEILDNELINDLTDVQTRFIDLESNIPKGEIKGKISKFFLMHLYFAISALVYLRINLIKKADDNSDFSTDLMPDLQRGIDTFNKQFTDSTKSAENFPFYKEFIDSIKKGESADDFFKRIYNFED